MKKLIKSKYNEYLLFRHEESKYLDSKDIAKEILKVIVISMFVFIFTNLMMEAGLHLVWSVPLVTSLCVLYDRFVLLFLWRKLSFKDL